MLMTGNVLEINLSEMNHNPIIERNSLDLVSVYDATNIKSLCCIH